MKQLLENTNKLLHGHQQKFERHNYTKNSSTEAIFINIKDKIVDVGHCKK